MSPGFTVRKGKDGRGSAHCPREETLLQHLQSICIRLASASAVVLAGRLRSLFTSVLCQKPLSPPQPRRQLVHFRGDARASRGKGLRSFAQGRAAQQQSQGWQAGA